MEVLDGGSGETVLALIIEFVRATPKRFFQQVLLGNKPR